MSSFNSVTLMGNLTKAPEVRVVSGDSTVAKFGLAVNEHYKGEEKAHFFDIEVWNKQADNCAKFLDKGSPVLVSGKLCQDRWKSEDGSGRSKVKVTAFVVQFLGKPKAPDSKAPDSNDRPPLDPDEDLPW